MGDNKAMVIMGVAGLATLVAMLVFSPEGTMDNTQTKIVREQEKTKRESEKTRQLELQWKIDSLNASKK